MVDRSTGETGRSMPRVIFFGMECQFSAVVLEGLFEGGIEVVAIVVPGRGLPGEMAVMRREEPRGRRRALSLLNGGGQRSLVEMGWARQIAVWEVGKLRHAETVGVLSGYEADVICVACFPRKVPQVIRDLPRLGCLNVHPSLLPANRGPVPLYWTLREGGSVTGVTIHALEEMLDSGDIFAQETVEVPTGIPYEDLEARCAERGGRLLAQTVWDLFYGRAMRMPQDESNSSYRSFPGDGGWDD